jgi:hypothetical protein
MATDGAKSAPSDPAQTQPTAASTGPAKPQRQKGRPSKAKAAAEQPGTPRLSQSRPMTSSCRLRHTFTTMLPARSTKVYLRLASPSTSRQSPPQVRCLPACLICGRSPADADHLRFAQPRAMGARSATNSPYPCAESITGTSITSETKSPWWERRAIDPLATSRMLWISTRRIDV